MHTCCEAVGLSKSWSQNPTVGHETQGPWDDKSSLINICMQNISWGHKSYTFILCIKKFKICFFL